MSISNSFEVYSVEGGLQERQGHTEATVALCELAGFKPCGVLCEVLRNDGNVARLPDLIKFAKKYNLKIISIPDLIEYIKNNQTKIRVEPGKQVKKMGHTLGKV